jgi:hypothetical protein
VIIGRSWNHSPVAPAARLAPLPALAAAALLLAGCGGHHKAAVADAATPKATATPTARPPSDAEQLRALLRTRAAATREGDAAALVRTSTGPQRRRDRHAAAAAGPLPLAHLAMVEQAGQVSGSHAVLHVETIYGFSGVHSLFVKHSRVTAVKSAQGWRIARDRALGVKAPWELGRYTVRHSRHFLALAPKGLHVGSLMSDLEHGRAEQRRGLPGAHPPGRMLVIVTRGTRDTRALTRHVRTLGALTALAEAQLTMRGPARKVSAITGQRILVLWSAYGGHPAQTRRMVIAHELTHAALAWRTSGRTPAWLVEGIAMYASGDQRAGDAGALLAGARLKVASQQGAAEHVLSLSRLAQPNAMNRLSTIPIAVAYSFSSAAAYAIASRHGRSALLRLYDAFNSARFRGHAGARLDDKVLRHTLHESLKSVQADAEAFARAHAV